MPKKIAGYTIKTSACIFLPKDLAIEVSIVMNHRGFKTLTSYIMHLLRKDIEKAKNENPELAEKIEKIKHMIKIKDSSSSTA